MTVPAHPYFFNRGPAPDRRRAALLTGAGLLCTLLACERGTQAPGSPGGKESIVARAQASIPGVYVGDWAIVAAPGAPALPADYGGLEVHLDASPARCTLTKNKGISRLELANGAAVTPGGRGVTVVFTAGAGLRLGLELSEPAPAEPVCPATFSHPNVPTWEGPVLLRRLGQKR